MEAIIKKESLNNIVLLGDGGAGKTSLLNSLLGREFLPDETSTHGISEKKSNKIPGANFIDLSGQEINENNFSAELENRRISAVVFVVNARSGDAETNIEKWNDLLEEVKSKNKLHKFLAFTKYDTHNFPINENRIKKSFDFSEIYKTDSKTGVGIQELRSAIRDSIQLSEDDDEKEFGKVSVIIRFMLDKFCKLIAENSNALAEIEWRDLERLIALTLEELGFSIVLTPGAKDGGKDIIATCILAGKEVEYYVEIKHWRNSSPGQKMISQFVELNARKCTDGGLFLSSSGYTNSVYRRVGELLTQKVRLGTQDKIVSLCKQYVLKKSGVWCTNTELPELLFEHTLS